MESKLDEIFDQSLTYIWIKALQNMWSSLGKMHGHSLITMDSVKLSAKLAIIQLMSQLANLNPIQESAFYREKVTGSSGAQLAT